MYLENWKYHQALLWKRKFKCLKCLNPSNLKEMLAVVTL